MLPAVETELSVKETATALIFSLDKLSKFDPIFSAFVPQKRKKTRPLCSPVIASKLHCYSYGNDDLYNSQDYHREDPVSPTDRRKALTV